MTKTLSGLVIAALISAAAASAQGTGPEAGEKIPAFEAVDQNGVAQTFESLRGPNGLLLLISRSADW